MNPVAPAQSSDWLSILGDESATALTTLRGSTGDRLVTAPLLQPGPWTVYIRANVRSGRAVLGSTDDSVLSSLLELEAPTAPSPSSSVVDARAVAVELRPPAAELVIDALADETTLDIIFLRYRPEDSTRATSGLHAADSDVPNASAKTSSSPHAGQAGPFEQGRGTDNAAASNGIADTVSVAAALHRALALHGIQVARDEQTQQRVGESTFAGIAAFQRAHGIDPAQGLDANTLDLLGLSNQATTGAANEVLQGTVVLDYGVPGDNLALRVYSTSFGGQRVLHTQGRTDGDGAYSFSGLPADGTPLSIYAVDADGNEVALSRTITDREALAAASLVAPGSLQPPSSEFARLQADIAPHLNGQALKNAVDKVTATTTHCWHRHPAGTSAPWPWVPPLRTLKRPWACLPRRCTPSSEPVFRPTRSNWQGRTRRASSRFCERLPTPVSSVRT